MRNTEGKRAVAEKYYNINSDGFSVRCKLYTDGKLPIRALIIAFHGFGGHKENRAAARFADRAISRHPGTAVLCFDLPCHGEDGQKKLSLQACDAYYDLILRDSREKYPEAVFYALAVSFGAWLCLREFLINGNPFKRVILRCPSLRMAEAVKTRILTPEDLEKLGKGKDTLAGFDRKVKINQTFLDDLQVADIYYNNFMDYADDILVQHGTKDEVIPIDEVREFCDRNVIELDEIQNADHRFTDPGLMDRAIANALRFLFEAGT